MNLTGYKLSRKWFDFCFENPEKIMPIHSALYFFAVEHCNRLGWKQKFSLPTEMAKEAIGVKSWHTYIKAFNELIEWKFFILIERSKNQYSANIIALTYFNEALDEALDEAMTKHASKHMTEQEQSIYQSSDSIYKLITNNLKPITDNYSKFEKFVISLSNKKKEKTESINCLFKNSQFNTIELFKKEFENTEWQKADLKHYFESIIDWSNSKGKMSKDWIATARNWMRKDKQESKLKLAPQPKINPQNDR